MSRCVEDYLSILSIVLGFSVPRSGYTTRLWSSVYCFSSDDNAVKRYFKAIHLNLRGFCPCLFHFLYFFFISLVFAIIEANCLVFSGKKDEEIASRHFPG